MAENFFEDPVEMSQGLETDFESDFADAQIRIEEKILGFFDANPGEIIGEINSGDLFKHFAEIKGAGIARFGHVAQAQVFGLVFLDEFFGARDDRGLGIFLLDDNLVGEH